MGVGISALGPGHASWIWTILAQAEISLLQEMSPILAKSGSPEETVRRSDVSLQTSPTV